MAMGKRKPPRDIEHLAPIRLRKPARPRGLLIHGPHAPAVQKPLGGVILIHTLVPPSLLVLPEITGRPPPASLG